MNDKTLIKRIYDRFYNDYVDASIGDKPRNNVDTFFEIAMIIVIILSIIPLAFKEQLDFFKIIEWIAFVLFLLDYMLRWITAGEKAKAKAEYKANLKDNVTSQNDKGKRLSVYNNKILPFVLYPFDIMAIVDLLSLVPIILLFVDNPERIAELEFFKIVRIARLFKFFRYSTNIKVLKNIFKKQKNALLTVFALAVGYVFLSALVIFNVDGDEFQNFFEALYWATTSLTTVGYGDVKVVSDVGRFVAMVSDFVGVAIIALPSGIITAGYMNELGVDKDKNKKQ